jgi:hypothetical protein
MYGWKKLKKALIAINYLIISETKVYVWLCKQWNNALASTGGIESARRVANIINDTCKLWRESGNKDNTDVGKLLGSLLKGMIILCGVQIWRAELKIPPDDNRIRR